VVTTRGNARRDDDGSESRNAARTLVRPDSARTRAIRRRFRPDVLVPRGFLPLVVH